MDGNDSQKPVVPPFPYNNKAGQAAANAGKPLAELHGDTSQIIERLGSGESAKQIAASIGVSEVALYRWLLRNSPDEWLSISAGKALGRLEKAREDLDSADNQVVIARAREAARLAQWDLERASRKLYGDNKADASGVTINVHLDRSCESGVTIDAG